MGRAKKLIVTRTKNGKSENVALGSLSHNELCEGLATQINQIQQLQYSLNNAYLSYANHLASQDALNKEEWLEFINKKPEAQNA